jgi:hypothetical protein
VGVPLQGFFASLGVTKCIVGTAILSSLERVGEVIFESLEFGVWSFSVESEGPVGVLLQGFFASLRMTKFGGGTAILNSL